jgi:hypothetical protein
VDTQRGLQQAGIQDAAINGLVQLAQQAGLVARPELPASQAPVDR